MRTDLLVSLLMCGVTQVAPAQAQANVNVALAETLFQEGRKLMQESQFEAACPKLERSQQLDPRSGTLANLAVCHENIGRLATAWAEYLEAEQMAMREGKPDRAQFAQEQARELFPKLSRLTIRPSGVATDPGLQITLDGLTMGPSLWNVATPVDPGEHELVARAPQRKPWTRSMKLAAGAAEIVTVPPLEPRQNAEDPVARWRLRLTIASSATGALLVGSVITGVIAHRRADHFAEINGDLTYSRDDWSDARSSAHAMQYVNAGFVGATVIGAGVTALLWGQRPHDTGARVAPWVSPNGAGLAVSGALQ